MLPKNFILLEAKLMAHKRLMDIYSRFLSQIKIIKNVLLKHLLIDDTVFKYQKRFLIYKMHDLSMKYTLRKGFQYQMPDIYFRNTL